MDLTPGKVTEEMRQRLLAEEFALRKKQPTAWTKTKYRPYANFRTRKVEVTSTA
ncbi:MAG: hypothetical protein ABH854_03565 [Candidatus Diapherotrites archaeon]